MSGVVKKAKPLIAAGVGAYVGFLVGGPSGALRGASIGYSLGSSKKPKGNPGGGMGSTNVSTPDTGQSATAIGEQAWVPKSFGNRRSGMVLTATDLTNANHEIVQTTGEFAYSVYTLGEGPWEQIKQLNYQNIKIFKDNQTINFGQIYSFEDAVFNTDIKNVEIEFVQGNATQSLSTMLSRVTWGYTGTGFTSGDRWYEDTDVGNGICYMVVRIKRDKGALIRETAPNFTIDSLGKRIPEIRLQGQTRQYSGGSYATGTNPAMVALDQLRSANFGLGLTNEEIDFDAFVKFANYCDNPGTYSNANTVPPFTINGQFNQGSSIKDILEQISLATGCLFADENGIVTVKLDKLETGTTTAQVNENNLIGNITRSEPTTSTTPNAINVTYLDSNAIETTEVVEFNNATITNEGRKEADLTLRMVQDPAHAREIAKRMLYHMRQPTYTFSLNNTGYGLDTYGISNIDDIFETTGVPASGLNMASASNKIRIFALQKERIQEDSNKAPVKVTAKLYSDQIYTVDPSGMTLASSNKTSDAPGIFNIPQPQNLVISTLSDTTAKLGWTDVYQYNTLIEFKNAGAADSTYIEDKMVGNGPADITLPGPGTYDISIRFLIPNTSINTGPGPRNVYLNYVSTGVGSNVNAQNGLLVIDGKLDKGLKKHMHIKYASNANGSGIRPSVPASQEIQKIEYADGSLSTIKPSTFEYNNATQTTEKVQITIPNDFDAGTSVPEKQEFSYAGNNANLIDVSTTGVNEQLQIILANGIETATDPGLPEIQSLAYLTASASDNSGTTYQVRFGSNNVGAAIISSGPSDATSVANAIKSRIDASAQNYTAVLTDDGIGNGLITITADADALVSDNWNIVITSGNTLGFNHSVIQAGVNGGKPRTDEGTVTGTTTNVRVNIQEDFAQSTMYTTLGSPSSTLFPNSGQIPTGAQNTTTRFYFAMRINTFTGATQPSAQTSNNVEFFADSSQNEQMVYLTETASGVNSNYWGNQQTDFASKSAFLTMWKNQTGNMMSTTTSSSTDIHWWNMGVNEDLGIIYFSAQAMNGTNFRVDHWANLNTAGGGNPQMYHDGDLICDFDMYWCHSAGSTNIIPKYRVRDTSSVQPYSSGSSSQDYWKGWAPVEFTKGISDPIFNIDAGGIAPVLGSTNQQKFLTRTIAGVLQAAQTKVVYNHFDGHTILGDYVANIDSPTQSQLEIDTIYGSQSSTRPANWLVVDQNYIAPSTSGTLSSFELIAPDGTVITHSQITNVPSGTSKNSMGSRIANAILSTSGFSRNAYSSTTSKFQYYRNDSNPYQVGNSFVLNHITPNTDGEAPNDIACSFVTISNAGDPLVQPAITFDPDINNTVYNQALSYTFERNLDRIGIATAIQAQVNLLSPGNIVATRTNHIVYIDFGTQANITAALTITNEGTNDGVNFTSNKFIINATDGINEVINGQLSNITVTSPETTVSTIIPLNNANSSLANINTSIVNLINNNANFLSWSATNDTGNNKIVITRNDQTASVGNNYKIAFNNKPNPSGSNPTDGAATLSDLTYGTDTDATLYQDSFDAIKTAKIDAKTFNFTGNDSVLLGGASVPTFGPVAFTPNATKVNAHTDILTALNANYTGTINKTLISGDPNDGAVDDVYQYEFEVNDDIGATFTFGAGTSGSASNITQTSSVPGLLGTKIGGGVITNSDILKTDVIFRDDSSNVIMNKSYFHLEPVPAYGYTNATFNDSVKADMATAITNLVGWSTLTSTNTLFNVQSASAAASNGQFQLNITNNGTVPSGNTLWSTIPSNGTFVTTQIGGGLATFYGLRATDLSTETIPDIAANASQYNWFAIENPNNLSTLYPSYKIVSGRIIEFEFDSNPLLAGYNNIAANNIINLDTPTTTVIENLPVNAPNSTPLNGSEMMFVDGSFYIAMRLSTNSTSVGTVINFVPVSGTLVYNDFTTSVQLTDQTYGTPTFITQGVYQYDGSQGWTKLN